VKIRFLGLAIKRKEKKDGDGKNNHSKIG